MKPTIYLALTHDWELRGNGSGDIEEIQFAPMRKLLGIYQKHGVRTSFYPDVMQQLIFRKLSIQHLELKGLADRWDEHLREAFRQGHDVQLHIHPQWLNAKYESGEWSLSADWSMLNYDEETIFSMVYESKQYLEALLQPLDASYRCIAFRAGALAIAPSPYLLGMLARLGIVLDASIAGGLYIDTTHVQLDYRTCEEILLPFYPCLDDARRVAEKPQEIICVPIHTFIGSRRQVLREHIDLLLQKFKQSVASKAATGDTKATDKYATAEWMQRDHSSPIRLIYDKGVIPYLTGKHLVSDTARLNGSLLKEMLSSIRLRARESGEREVPIVLTNHPKEIRSFSALERFIAELAQAEDVKFITLTDLARKLLAAELPVRGTASGRQPPADKTRD